MCAFIHSSNELLRAFNEQCVHLTILFQRLDYAHYLHATKGYVLLLLVAMNDWIYVFSVYKAGKKGSFALKKHA